MTVSGILQKGELNVNNFEFCVGTDILFGRGQEARLPEKLAPYGRRILLTYGGGSIKKSGLYDKIKNLLREFEIFELGGIDPNPRVESVTQGAALCRQEKIDLILAVGGGSTIDCSKAIAAAVYYDGDAWDLPAGRGQITKALPVAAVLTLAATGSEMDAIAVISNMATNEKRAIKHPALLPRVAVLNPENTFTVPPFQTASGSADMMSHVIETYFDPVEAFVPDAIAEGLLRAIIRYTPAALANPEDYEARAQLMWTGSLAINGILSTGKNNLWSCHAIEHELSAFYDITHGAGLAVLTPRWMRHILSEATLDKFCDYAANVWGFAPGGDKWALARQGIDATEAFFRQIGLPATLGEFGIDDSKFQVMAEKAVAVGRLDRVYVPLTPADVVEIFRACL